MALTNTEIKNFKPTDKVVNHADIGGLYLRVYPTGTKTFMHRTRVGGKARWTTLGNYPTLSLADARIAASSAIRTNVSSQTSIEAYTTWLNSIHKVYKSPEQVTYRMDKYLKPFLQKHDLDSVTRAKLSDMLTTIAATAPVQANRVLGDIKLFFSYCVERGWLDNNPAQLITQKTVGGRETTRSRVLTPEEIKALIHELRTDRFQDRTRWALALCLLTGQRSGEVRSMDRQQIQNEVWKIPDTVSKNGVAQNVYLPLPVMRLLPKMFRRLGKTPFKGMEGQTLARAVKRMGVTWTPHDLRRTMATRMADMGVMPHVIEKCLNHTMGGVMAIYNRSEYAAEKKAAWRLWVRWVLAQRKPPLIAGV